MGQLEVANSDDTSNHVSNSGAARAGPSTLTADDSVLLDSMSPETTGEIILQGSNPTIQDSEKIPRLLHLSSPEPIECHLRGDEVCIFPSGDYQVRRST